MQNIGDELTVLTARWMKCPRCRLSAHCCKFCVTLLEYIEYMCLLTDLSITGGNRRLMMLEKGHGKQLETFNSDRKNKMNKKN